MFGRKEKCDEERSTNDRSKETQSGRFAGRYRMDTTDSNDSIDKEATFEQRCRCKSKGKTVTIECDINRTSSGSRETGVSENTEPESDDTGTYCQCCKRPAERQRSASRGSTRSNTSASSNRSRGSCVSARSSRSEDSRCSSDRSMKYVRSEKIYITAQNLYINDPVNISGNLAGANDPKNYNFGDPQPSYGFKGNAGGGQGTVFMPAINIGSQHVHNYGPQESRRSACHLPVTNGDEQRSNFPADSVGLRAQVSYQRESLSWPANSVGLQAPVSDPRGSLSRPADSAGLQAPVSDPRESLSGPANIAGLQAPVSDRRESLRCPPVKIEDSFCRSLMGEDQQSSPYFDQVNNVQQPCCQPRNNGQRVIYSPVNTGSQMDPRRCRPVNIGSQQGICVPVDDGGQQQSCCCPPRSDGQEQASCCPPANDEDQQETNGRQQNPCSCVPINTGDQQESSGFPSLNNGVQQSSSSCQPVNPSGQQQPHSCPSINHAGQQRPCCCQLVSNSAQQQPFCCPPVNNSDQDGSSNYVPSNGGQPQPCRCRSSNGAQSCCCQSLNSAGQQGLYSGSLTDNTGNSGGQLTSPENGSNQEATPAPNISHERLPYFLVDNRYPATSTGITRSHTGYQCCPSDTGGGHQGYPSFHTNTDKGSGGSCTRMVTEGDHHPLSTDLSGNKKELSPSATSIAQHGYPYFSPDIHKRYPCSQTSISQEGYPNFPIHTDSVRQVYPIPTSNTSAYQQDYPYTANLPQDNLTQQRYPSIPVQSNGHEGSSDGLPGDSRRNYSGPNSGMAKARSQTGNNERCQLTPSTNENNSYRVSKADAHLDEFGNSVNSIQRDEYRARTHDSQSSSLKEPSCSKSNLEQAATVGTHPCNTKICDTSMALLQTAPTAMGLLCGMELHDQSHQREKVAQSRKNRTCLSQD